MWPGWPVTQPPTPMTSAQGLAHAHEKAGGSYLGHAVHALPLLHARQDLVLHQLSRHRLGLVRNSLHSTTSEPDMGAWHISHLSIHTCGSAVEKLSATSTWPSLALAARCGDAQFACLQCRMPYYMFGGMIGISHLSSGPKALLDELVCHGHCVLGDGLHTKQPASARSPHQEVGTVQQRWETMQCAQQRPSQSGEDAARLALTLQGPDLGAGLDALVDGLVSHGARVLLHSTGCGVDGLLVELVCLGPGLV